ncbi:MAG: hypothetical protein ACRCX8_18505 [Sarcina sp.]
MNNKMTKLTNVDYDTMEEFVLNNVEYTYNVEKCLADFIGDLGESSRFYDTFEIDNVKFEIREDSEIDEEENITYTYNIKLV